MPSGKCIFSERWLSLPAYSDWLERDKNVNSAKCSMCKKTFDIGNMGEPALRSHAKGAKHQELIQIRNAASGCAITTFFGQKNDPKSTVTTTAATGKNGSATVDSYVTRTDVLKAEILWTLKVVKSHYSFNSCADIQQVLSLMFPSCEAIKQFSCGERKCSYLCNFGIAPHFKQLLTKEVNEQDSHVILFDESLNSPTKNKQMDIHVRMWDKNQVN